MKKTIIWVLILLLGIIILSLILLPGIAKRYAIKHSKELVGRQIDMDKLGVNYFTGKVKITDFKMFEANDSDVFVSFDTLIIKLKPFQLFNNQFIMERFYISGLHAKVILYDSTFNFDDLIAFYESEEDTVVADTASEEPFRFHLSNIEFKHTRLEFENKILEDTMIIKDLSFFIPYIGWNQEEKSEADLRFAFNNEGYFESSINVNPIDGDFDANITINTLYLDGFREYAAEYINISELHGKLNSRIDVLGNINEPEKSIVTGSIEVADFSMYDTKNKQFLGASRMECKLQSIDYHQASYIFDSLILTQPYVYFELDTNTNNFFEIFNISYDENDTASIAQVPSDTLVTETSETLYYAINHLAVKQGVVDYRDLLTGEPFDYYLNEIEMVADSLLSTSDWVNTYATMLLNKRGKLVAEVGFDPDNPYDIKLDYVITDFQLGDLNIYSRFYMGFPIIYGDMYYKSTTEILNGQLKSDNKLVMTNVELGEKSGGLHDLPLKFALFLLRDRNGVINLEIPVRGDLNDPRVSLGKILWNTFKNLIVKVAAAPFDLLAGLISVDPKDIKAIEYDYYDTALTEGRKRQLDLLLELEQKKDGLDIELVYFNDVENEKKAIAVEETAKLFYEQTTKEYRKHPDEFEAFVRSKMANDSLDIAQACLEITDSIVLDSLANLFAAIRKASIEHYLALASDSTTIHTSVSNPNAPKNVGSLPIFEVKYTMKGAHPEEE